jgi:signal transduction histidine kinase
MRDPVPVIEGSLTTEILDSVGSGIIAVDLENRILWVNRAFARRLSLDADQCVGQPAKSLLPTVEPCLVPPAVLGPTVDWQADASIAVSRDLDWRLTGQILHLREDGCPLRNASGKVIGRVFSYHDLSWEKAIDQMKSEFISVASHELRTPLTSIKGSVDLILAGFAQNISAEARELLQIAQAGCDRLIRLINDILDLSKIEAGRLQLHLVPTDLSEIVESSIASLQQFASQRQAVLRLAQLGNIPKVEVDRDRIEQVLTNLISNAIKFSPAGGEVSIELSAENGGVQCSVTDHGCGIAENELGRVFGKFQQLSNSQRHEGSGLGLAISHALVEEHGGRIWVESRVNQGSRFTFRLPVAKKSAAHSSPAPSP